MANRAATPTLRDGDESMRGETMTTHEQAKPDEEKGLAARKKHEDALLDQALEESFPASDPPSTLVSDLPATERERVREARDRDAADKKP